VPWYAGVTNKVAGQGVTLNEEWRQAQRALTPGTAMCYIDLASRNINSGFSSFNLTV